MAQILTGQIFSIPRSQHSMRHDNTFRDIDFVVKGSVAFFQPSRGSHGYKISHYIVTFNIQLKTVPVLSLAYRQEHIHTIFLRCIISASLIEGWMTIVRCVTVWKGFQTINLPKRWRALQWQQRRKPVVISDRRDNAVKSERVYISMWSNTIKQTDRLCISRGSNLSCVAMKLMMSYQA